MPRDRGGDRPVDVGGGVDDAAVGPFEPAVARHDVGIAEHHQLAGEAALGCDRLQALLLNMTAGGGSCE